MSADTRKLNFFNFYKLYFPLTYNPEIFGGRVRRIWSALYLLASL